MLGNMDKITIRGQQREPMFAAGCSNEKVYGPRLYSLRAAVGSESGCCHIGVPLQWKEREGFKELEKMIASSGGTDSVQKLLEDIPDQENPITRLNVGTKRPDKRIRFVHTGSPEDKGPYRGVNDEVHGPGDLSCDSTLFGILSCPAREGSAVDADVR